MRTTAATNSPVTSGATPLYGGAFRCIGADCEDTCCQNWGIPLDRQTYEKYQTFPDEVVASLVQQYVTKNPAAGTDSLYATITLTEAGTCPFFSVDRLCGVQKEYGADALGATCSIYPRILNQVGDRLEMSLTLSCPEAARQVLLDPDFMKAAGNAETLYFRTDQFTRLASQETTGLHKPYDFFHEARSLIVDLIRLRSCSLGHRLVLIGELCRRLSEIKDVAGDERVPAILNEARAMMEQGPTSAGAAPHTAQPALQMDLVLQLTAQRLKSGVNGGRFREMFQLFLQGIGYTKDSTADGDLSRYLSSETEYLRPYLRTQPQVLENYLLNYVYRSLFPFGRSASVHYTPRSIFDEYILMATQYVWVYGLLAGVAGHYRQSFSAEHVIHTMQSLARAVEHDPGHATRTVEYMKSRGLADMGAMASLLSM